MEKNIKNRYPISTNSFRHDKSVLSFNVRKDQLSNIKDFQCGKHDLQILENENTIKIQEKTSKGIIPIPPNVETENFSNKLKSNNALIKI